jgi:hypothetical protein
MTSTLFYSSSSRNFFLSYLLRTLRNEYHSALSSIASAILNDDGVLSYPLLRAIISTNTTIVATIPFTYSIKEAAVCV